MLLELVEALEMVVSAVNGRIVRPPTVESGAVDGLPVDTNELISCRPVSPSAAPCSTIHEPSAGALYMYVMCFGFETPEIVSYLLFRDPALAFAFVRLARTLTGSPCACEQFGHTLSSPHSASSSPPAVPRSVERRVAAARREAAHCGPARARAQFGAPKMGPPPQDCQQSFNAPDCI